MKNKLTDLEFYDMLKEMLARIEMVNANQELLRKQIGRIMTHILDERKR